MIASRALESFGWTRWPNAIRMTSNTASAVATASTAGSKRAAYRCGTATEPSSSGSAPVRTSRSFARLRKRHARASSAWHDLTEAAPQLVWANLRDGTMDYASAQVEQYLGRSESELLAWGWLEVLHPDDRDRTEQTQRARRRGPKQIRDRTPLARFDGTYRWFKTRGVAARDGEGRIYKWFGTCTDITTNKQLEKCCVRRMASRVDLAVLAARTSASGECDMPDGHIREQPSNSLRSTSGRIARLRRFRERSTHRFPLGIGGRFSSTPTIVTPTREAVRFKEIPCQR